ncbi:hypothetical protein [Haloarchaeobius iranensis]|uniref:Uncharacterized protein n=1 Tax=Haloarchaeobius iranensis TaxID=996166 RepID=A0A1G9WX17_9EURY|nr:hypothetical protein [Haloarchaeobius iranensis]SDM89124.1 hypothetical protein SAMN05192554_10932 [Haloarchaeobius iranensis]
MDADDELVEQVATQLDGDEETARGFLDGIDAAVGSICPLCGEGYVVETDDERFFPSRGRQARSLDLGVMELSLSKSRELRETNEEQVVVPYTCTSANPFEVCALAGRFHEQVAVETVRGVAETDRAVRRRRSYVADRLSRGGERL